MYRRYQSCEDAFSLCIDRWQSALDKGYVMAFAFLGLSKAFDRMHHQDLSDLLECGVGSCALRWFRSYLSDRQQTVCCPDSPPSPLYQCSCSVLQGSVFGPLLITIYTRNLPCFTMEHTQLYADDIVLFSIARDPTSTSGKLELAVGAVHMFLQSRGLVLHAEAKFLYICCNNTSLGPPLRNGSATVPPSISTKYFGLRIDEHPI